MPNKIDSVLVANGMSPRNPHLQQYGVPGMRWGQRKARGSSSSSSPAKPASAKPTKSQAPVKTPNTFKAKPQNRRMTDAELRNRLNRLQMEKQYKELTTSPKGKSFVKEVLSDTGKQAARQVLGTAAKVGVQLAIESAAKSSSGSTKVFLSAMAAQGAKKGKGGG